MKKYDVKIYKEEVKNGITHGYTDYNVIKS